MAGKRALLFDPGPNIGDNCRAFILFKAFGLANPELELTCWLSPEVEAKLGPLLRASRAVDRFVTADRSPGLTLELNQDLLKRMMGRSKELSWRNCPPGQGPDGREYDLVIPTGEPWLTAKLLSGRGLKEAETINQGRFLALLLELSQAQAAQAVPLFGNRSGPEELLTVGLCRPEPDDPKQLPASRRQLIWEMILKSGFRAVAMDLQDWSPPPDSARIRDLRSAGLTEKVEVFNRALVHIGTDGGLLHFAAACGCPTLGFYHGPERDPGLIHSPWPRSGEWGGHL